MNAFFTSNCQAKVSKTSDSTGQTTQTRIKYQPWVEKYRPKSMDDIVYQEEVVSVLKKSITTEELPNLLFYGPPGTGKTSTILALAKELFGDIYKSRILELNASDERGISIIREKVKNFAQLTVSNSSNKKYPSLKIIILDEADSMTPSAQSALRRTMEKESKSTRFCLICNYISRIIEPITSRCAKFRFKPFNDQLIYGNLVNIMQKEKMKYEKEALDYLVSTSDGDMRKAITSLQSLSRLKGDEVITQKDVFETIGFIDIKRIEDMFKVLSQGSYEKIDLLVKELICEAYSASQCLNQIHDYVLSCHLISDKTKAIILEEIAVVDKRLLDGSDEYIQLLYIFSTIMKNIV